MQLTMEAGELAGLQSFTDTLLGPGRALLYNALKNAVVNEDTETVSIELDDPPALLDSVEAELRRPGHLLDPNDALAWGIVIGAYHQARTQPGFNESELDDLFNILDWEIKYDEGAEPEDLERRRRMRARIAAVQDA
jgi:hypothetical protein